jgi:hypothetical protein
VSAAAPRPSRVTTLIVRRGAAERFAYLQTALDDEPIELIWDRRVGERRGGTGAEPDRRAGDRRVVALEAEPFTSLDRRGGQRRQPAEPRGPERRVGERRRRPPFTWTTLDFVVGTSRSLPACGAV